MPIRHKYNETNNTFEVNSHVFEIKHTGAAFPVFDGRELALPELFTSRQFETINISKWISSADDIDMGIFVEVQ
jgi:hypothetical protein